MTPKSLLRHPEAVSRAQDLVVDRFHHLLDDPAVTDARRIRRLLFCSGKIYYELAARRAELRRSDVAIVRLEQLYPFRVESIKPILEKYAGAEEIVWVQEEPKNMGAWRHVDAFLRDNLEMRIKYVGRDANASPAVASTKMHTQQQERILILALGLPNADGEGDERRPRPARREPAARRG
jgi:2-oxoglutarate dehydrogenase E1 component